MRRRVSRESNINNCKTNETVRFVWSLFKFRKKTPKRILKWKSNEERRTTQISMKMNARAGAPCLCFVSPFIFAFLSQNYDGKKIIFSRCTTLQYVVSISFFFLHFARLSIRCLRSRHAHTAHMTNEIRNKITKAFCASHFVVSILFAGCHRDAGSGCESNKHFLKGFSRWDPEQNKCTVVEIATNDCRSIADICCCCCCASSSVKHLRVVRRCHLSSKLSLHRHNQLLFVDFFFTDSMLRFRLFFLLINLHVSVAFMAKGISFTQIETGVFLSLLISLSDAVSMEHE